MRLRRWSAFALLAALTLVVGAPPASAATTVEVEAGWAGTFDPGDHLPVRVRIAADRLTRGEVEVRHDRRNGGGGGSEDVHAVVPVEIPGGSAKEYVVALPTNSDPTGVTVVATFRADGREVAKGTASAEPQYDVESVGLLPGALAGGNLPGAAPLAVDAGTARFAEVGPEELGFPEGLSGLDVLAAARGELATLDDGARSVVHSWLSEGGRLLVDEAPGEPVPGLPDTWQPGPDGRVAVGQGEVRAVGGAVTGGRWAGLVEPTPIDRAGLDQFSQTGSVEQALAVDAGVRLPELNWLVGFLLVYVVGAVPITLTLLRRAGRAEWGWVAVPLVAVLFTGAGYGAGRGLRSDTNLSHATTLFTNDANVLASVSVGVASPGGGDVVTGFPRGWSPSTTDNWMHESTGTVTAVRANEGVNLRQRLQPGQFTTHSARGLVDLEGRLEVRVDSVEGETVRGTVRNTLPFALHEIAVFHGLTATKIGSVDAGAEAAFEIELFQRDDAWEAPATRMWQRDGFDVARFDEWGGGFGGAPSADDVFSLAQFDRVSGSAPSGGLNAVVTAAGWTRDYRPPVTGDGDDGMKGRTLVLSSAPITRGDTGFHRAAVRTAKVRTPLNDGSPLVVRFVLPEVGEPIDTAGLVARAPANGLNLEVWLDGAWAPLDPAGVTENGTVGPMNEPAADHRLPAGAAQDGIVWLRTPLNQASEMSFVSALDLITLEPAP